MGVPLVWAKKKSHQAFIHINSWRTCLQPRKKETLDMVDIMIHIDIRRAADMEFALHSLRLSMSQSSNWQPTTDEICGFQKLQVNANTGLNMSSGGWPFLPQDEDVSSCLIGFQETLWVFCLTNCFQRSVDHYRIPGISIRNHRWRIASMHNAHSILAHSGFCTCHRWPHWLEGHSPGHNLMPP